MSMDLEKLYSYHTDKSQLFGSEIYPYKKFFAHLPERARTLEEEGEILNQRLEEMIRIMPHPDKDVEKFIITPNNYSADLVIPYATQVLKKRWPEGEQAIINDDDAFSARHYAHMFNARIPELEQLIMQSPEQAFYYAIDTLESRWPEAEKYIKQDEGVWQEYMDVWGIDESI